jgi:hypothetical protein
MSGIEPRQMLLSEGFWTEELCNGSTRGKRGSRAAGQLGHNRRDLIVVQPPVLRPSLPQDGDVEIGSFPQGEETFIGRSSFFYVALDNVGSGETDVG